MASFERGVCRIAFGCGPIPSGQHEELLGKRLGNDRFEEGPQVWIGIDTIAYRAGLIVEFNGSFFDWEMAYTPSPSVRSKFRCWFVNSVFLNEFHEFWKRIRGKVYPSYSRLWDASSKQMTALSGMLSGIRVVKAFAKEDRENKRFQSAAEQYANARYSAMITISPC